MEHKKQTGFTIVETMIAVMVFSVLALIAIMAIMQISKSYQAGAIKAQLLDASRQVHAQFTQAVGYGQGESSATLSNGFRAWCTGNTRFIWKPSDASNVYTYDTAGGGSLYGDTIDGTGSCGSAAFNPATAKRLLPSNSFVTEFSPTAVTSGVYSLSTRFGVGSRDMFSGNDVTKSCQSARLLGLEFCAVVEYDSTALRKVGN